MSDEPIEKHGISPWRHPLRWLSYVITGETDEDVRRMQEDAVASRAEINRRADDFESAADDAYQRGDDRLARVIMKASGAE